MYTSKMDSEENLSFLIDQNEEAHLLPFMEISNDAKRLVVLNKKSMCKIYNFETKAITDLGKLVTGGSWAWCKTRNVENDEWFYLNGNDGIVTGFRLKKDEDCFD